MIVVVSTHLDDAVFSAWSVLDGAEEVIVLTVFTAGPDDDRITDWDRDTGVTSSTRMTQRAAENDAALAVAGCNCLNLGLRERQYGGGDVGPAILEPYLAGASAVYIPIAGARRPDQAHPEHRVVRDACRIVRPDSSFYADNPYWHFGDDAQLPPGLIVESARVVVELDPEQRRRKAEAISCYAGELHKLDATFGLRCADPSQLRHEVYWRPS